MLENIKKDMADNKINTQGNHHRRLKEILLLDLFGHLTIEAQDEIIQNIKTMLNDGRIKKHSA